MNDSHATLSNDSATDTRPASLYRLFSRTGELLYVGMTLNFFSRLDNHRSGKPWWLDVRTVTVIPYPTRREAEDAERAAIIHERPKWNEQIRQPGIARKPRNDQAPHPAAKADLPPCEVTAETVAAARLGLEAMDCRAIRERAGISQTVMAEKIGVTAAALSRQEAGNRKPRAETAVRWHALLKALEVQLADVADRS